MGLMRMLEDSKSAADPCTRFDGHARSLATLVLNCRSIDELALNSYKGEGLAQRYTEWSSDIREYLIRDAPRMCLGIPQYESFEGFRPAHLQRVLFLNDIVGPLVRLLLNRFTLFYANSPHAKKQDLSVTILGTSGGIRSEPAAIEPCPHCDVVFGVTQAQVTAGVDTMALYTYGSTTL